MVPSTVRSWLFHGDFAASHDAFVGSDGTLMMLSWGFRNAATMLATVGRV